MHTTHNTQVEVHQIVQPIIEKVTKATVLEIKPPISEELGTRVVEATFEAAQPAVVGTTVISPAQPLPVPAESRSEVVSVVQRHEELPPIVEETVHRKIVERITPLILVLPPHTTRHDTTRADRFCVVDKM
jgi:hypothetical protein